MQHRSSGRGGKPCVSFAPVLQIKPQDSLSPGHEDEDDKKRTQPGDDPVAPVTRWMTVAETAAFLGISKPASMRSPRRSSARRSRHGRERADRAGEAYAASDAGRGARVLSAKRLRLGERVGGRPRDRRDFPLVRERGERGVRRDGSARPRGGGEFETCARGGGLLAGWKGLAHPLLATAGRSGGIEDEGTFRSPSRDGAADLGRVAFAAEENPRGSRHGVGRRALVGPLLSHSAAFLVARRSWLPQGSALDRDLSHRHRDETATTSVTITR